MVSFRFQPCPVTRISTGFVRPMYRATLNSLVELHDSWEMPTIVGLMTVERANVTRILADLTLSVAGTAQLKHSLRESEREPK